MTEKIKIAVSIFFFIVFVGHIAGKESKKIAIKGALIIPVVGGEIPYGTILIRNGRIDAIGKDVAIPEDAKIIDASGLRAYPGLIDTCTNLGLNEISFVAATVDDAEIGRINPQLRTLEAIRPDNIHIAFARSFGITAAHVVPSGLFIAGESTIIQLCGRITKEMIVKKSAFMFINCQTTSQFIGNSIVQGKSFETIAVELKMIFENARLYQKCKQAATKNLGLKPPMFDETMESLIPVVDGRLPVMFNVETEDEIKAAIKFVKEERIKTIFLGASDAWKMTEEIKEANIPLVLSSLYRDPKSWEDGYDAHYCAPSILLKAGIKFAFSSHRYFPPYSIDLPYQASKAIAFGMDEADALKCVTIVPAEILGVADTMGSLETGKTANIILTNGDILDRRTQIKRVFINGNDMDLSNRYTKLLEKFKQGD